MRGFLALAFFTFWLTSFPLQGCLLPEKEPFKVFLIFHFMGYLGSFLLYNFLEKKKFFPISIFLIALLTLIYPFLSSTYKLTAISLLGLISPLMALFYFYYLKGEKGLLWPYTGLIFGNLLTLLIYPISQKSLPLAHLILASSLVVPLFIKNLSQEFAQEVLYLQRKDFFYLYGGIFIFYLTSPLIYNWLSSNFRSFEHSLQMDLIFYSLGILISMAYLKATTWTYKGLFILAATFISLANTALHFEKVYTFYLGRFLLFSGSGLMDLITLYIFVNHFKNLRNTALLYALICLSILIGNIFFEFIQIEKEYLLSYLALISLFSLLFFYKMSLEKIKEDVPEIVLPLEETSEEPQRDSEMLTYEKPLETPQTLQDKLNQCLAASVKKLSKRECEVIYYYALEERNLTEIAELLQISRSSAKEYLKRACMKLGISQYELKDFLSKILIDA